MVEIVFARVADDFAYRSWIDCDVEGVICATSTLSQELLRNRSQTKCVTTAYRLSPRMCGRRAVQSSAFVSYSHVLLFPFR